MSLGVRIYEDTKATALEQGRRRRARHDAARRGSAPARSRSAPNAFKPLLQRHRPLHRPGLRLLHGHRAADAGAAGRASAGPTARACSDIPNQFHYYRLTEDNRILWGGYDAIYYWRRQGQRRAGEPAGDVGQAEQALLRDVPAARGREVHATSGAARSTRAAASACSGDRRCRAASPTRSATPASASRRRRFGGEVMLDLLDGKRIAGDADRLRQGQAAAVPARAVPLRRHPGDAVVAGPRGPHRQAQRRGCAPSTGSASASTARRA